MTISVSSLSTQTRVNEETLDPQRLTDVIQLSGGDYLVTYQASGHAYYRAFFADGTAKGASVEVASTGSDLQGAALADGGFAGVDGHGRAPFLLMKDCCASLSCCSVQDKEELMGGHPPWPPRMGCAPTNHGHGLLAVGYCSWAKERHLNPPGYCGKQALPKAAKAMKGIFSGRPRKVAASMVDCCRSSRISSCSVIMRKTPYDAPPPLAAWSAIT